MYLFLVHTHNDKKNMLRTRYIIFPFINSLGTIVALCTQFAVTDELFITWADTAQGHSLLYYTQPAKDDICVFKLANDSKSWLFTSFIVTDDLVLLCLFPSLPYSTVFSSSSMTLFQCVCFLHDLITLCCHPPF